MKKRLFLFIVALVFAFLLGSCNYLEQKEVELGASVSYKYEMTEKTSQKVTIEITDKSFDGQDYEVSYKGLDPEIAEISSEGVIKAHKPGEAEFEVIIVVGEAKKEVEFKVTVPIALIAFVSFPFLYPSLLVGQI